MKTAFLVTISKGTTVTLGDCLCRPCASISVDGFAADIMKYLEEEDRIAAGGESGMEVGGGGEKEKDGCGGRGGDGDDDDATFVDAKENLDDILGSESGDDVVTIPSQGSQGLH